VGDSPVSYPYVWNIWKFDWVQYNGSVSQPLARNVGEALGVGAIVPLTSATGQPLPPVSVPHFRGHPRPASHRADAAEAAHQLARAGPGRHRSRRPRAAGVFERHCECHGPHVAEGERTLANAPLKPNGLEWRMEVIPLDHIGTDPNAAVGFMNRRYDLSASGLSNAELQEALRPLLTRQLLRDVRFRLREVVRLSTDQSGKIARLPPRWRTGGASRVLPRPGVGGESVIPAELFADRCGHRAAAAGARAVAGRRLAAAGSAGLRAGVSPGQSAVGSARGQWPAFERTLGAST
jgi:hypothetical protein